MNVMKRILTLVVMGCMIASAVPAFCEEEGLGEWVSEAAPKGPSALIPAGHFALLAKYADQFLSTAPGGHRTIFASSLMDGKDDPLLADELNDFFIVDVRTPAEFCKSTVPGAININLPDLAKPENLAKLPTDQPILIVCNTGHTASIANAVLGTLGYNAWTLRFGMMGWRGTTGMKVWSPAVSQTIFGAGYAVQTCP